MYLPGERLAFVRVRFSRPLDYSEEMQAHHAVRILVDARDPRIRGDDPDAQFLAEFALQGAFDGLAWFHLAARKLPVACIHLALGSLRQQKPAVGMFDDRGRDCDLA